MAALARTEFSSALAAIAKESGLEPSLVLDTVRQAILAAFRRDARERGEEISEETEFDVSLDPGSGEAHIFEVKDGGKRDVTPPGFGRIAVQTAKQVILQKIREAEKEAVLAQYAKRIGSLVSGTVLRFDGPNVKVDIGRTEGILPPQERIPNEKFALNQRLTFLLKEIRETDRGREIILSRADPEIVKKLFSREVPEIGSGAVQIMVIAREAGNRTKIAVSSSQSGVDPVGSCVGQKGVRVQAVIGELNEEKIDVIPWTEDQAQLITSALSPAEGVSVTLDREKKQAVVRVPEEQLSLAIGRDGQNVRLASKLTDWNIKIEGAPASAHATAGKPAKSAKSAKSAKPAGKVEGVETELEKAEKKEDVSEDAAGDQVAATQKVKKSRKTKATKKPSDQEATGENGK